MSNRKERLTTMKKVFIALLALTAAARGQSGSGAWSGSSGGGTTITGGNCATGTYTTGITVVTGVPVCSAVAFSQLTGSAVKAQLPGTVVHTDQTNTYSTGTQDMSLVTAFVPKMAAGYSPTTNGHFGYDSTAHRLVAGINGVMRRIALQGAGTPATDDCAKFDASGHLVSAGAACGSGGGGTFQVRGYQTLTSGTTVSATASTNNAFLLVLGHNVGTFNFNSPVTGQRYDFRICQPASGSPFTLAWPAGFTRASTIDPTLGACSNQSFVWDSAAAMPIGAMYVTDVAGSLITLFGSSSGSATLAAPAVAGSATAHVLPAAAGNLLNDAASIGVDFSGKATTKPNKTGTTPPATCSQGETFLDTDAPLASQSLVCSAGNVWTAQGGSGGSPVLTTGYCFLVTNCDPPVVSLASNAFSTQANRVYVMQIIMPYTMTLAQLTARVGAGVAGTASAGVAIGLFADSTNAPGGRLGGCAFVDTTVNNDIKTCSITISQITAGTVVWVAAAAENVLSQLRTHPGDFSLTMADLLDDFGRSGYCQNPATGTGTGLTLPLTCGTLTNFPWAVPVILGRP